jgi:Raf kinase inhibitor-like YbhB/YbcL family protein
MALGRFGAALGGACLVATAAVAAPARLHVRVDDLAPGAMIPTPYAACVAKVSGHMGFGADINPAVSWSKGPAGTLSYAVTLTDTDSPAAHRERMNKEGVTLTPDVQRHVFFHWVLIDIPANVTSIAKGTASHGLVAKGKTSEMAPAGVSGENDYTMAFAKNPAMAGTYTGYDGPCPPWNDEVVHHYHFTVYALSVAKLDVAPGFDGRAALAAMQGKILAEGEVVHPYTTNPAKGAQVQAAP